MRAMLLLAGVTSVIAAGACQHDEQSFRCEDSSQCLSQGAEGLCETTGFCSFPTTDCVGGRRYGAHAESPLASSCVPARSCGDGVIQTGEECDDGNRVNDDLCTNGCVRCGPSDGNARFSWDKTSSCYTRNDQALDFSAAAESCAVSGGHLLSASTSVEHEAVVNELLVGATGSFWIGMSDRTDEGIFVWTTREPNFAKYWRRDEPASTTDNHDCVALAPKSGGPGFDWVVRPCSEKLRYVCERPPWLVNPRDRHAYKVIYRNLTWGQGRDVCKQFAGHLGTLNSAEEHDFVTQRYFGRYWLGGNDVAREGVFVWVTGERWRFQNFALTEPDNWGGRHNCLDMADERRWHDQDCEKAQAALCELD